jgi:hypothetical protein
MIILIARTLARVLLVYKLVVATDNGRLKTESSTYAIVIDRLFPLPTPHVRQRGFEEGVYMIACIYSMPFGSPARTHTDPSRGMMQRKFRGNAKHAFIVEGLTWSDQHFHAPSFAFTGPFSPVPCPSEENRCATRKGYTLGTIVHFHDVPAMAVAYTMRSGRNTA